MFLERRRYHLSLVIISFFFTCETAIALEIEPGVGLGLEATNNVKLTRDNEISDQIATGYAGISIAENEGYLKYDAKASANKHTYLQDTYKDQTYYRLQASADWEMMPQRFSWFMSDAYTQRLNKILDPNTPDNVQDTNVFNFGAKINIPLSERQNISFIPSFTQYYYEKSATNNRHLAITGNWNYLLYPLVNIGITMGARKVDYFDERFIDSKFTNAAFVIDGQRVTSKYSVNLGATTVSRDDIRYKDTTGFSGSLKIATDVSSRSTFNTLLLTDLTDTSSVSNGLIGDPNDVVVEDADVIRNSLVNLAYQRHDELLRSRIWAEYRKLTYSNLHNNDRLVRSFGTTFEYPLTEVLSSDVYLHYSRTTQLETSQEDKKTTIGGSLKYRFSPDLYSTLGIKYRIKDSTDEFTNYDETSVYLNVVYGYGGITRPTRTGY